MDLYDWLLFLHVLAAFMTVAAVALFVAIHLARRGHAEPPAMLRLAPLAGLLWAIGGLAVLVLGLWLAIYLKAYHPWDGWVIAAIVLWVIASAAGGRISTGLRRARTAAAGAVAAEDRQAVVLHAVLVLSVLALIVDMIYKPGAG